MSEKGIPEWEKRRRKGSILHLLKRIAHPSRKETPVLLDEETVLKDTYRIKGVVRVFPHKVHYLAAYQKGELTLKCFECGYESNIKGDKDCASCGAPLSDSPLLLSQRWQKELYREHLDTPLLNIIHPNLSRVYDLFEEAGNLYSVLENVEGDPITEIPSPLPSTGVAEIGIKLGSAISYLIKSGLRVSSLAKDDIIISGEKVTLLDPDLKPLGEGGEAKRAEREMIMALSRLLKEYLFIDSPHLRSFLDGIDEGISTGEFLRTLEESMVSETPELSPCIGALSDVGILRSTNEDSWGWEEIGKGYNLYMVADGMGGHERGEVASKMAIKGFSLEIASAFEEDGDAFRKDIPGVMKRAALTVNRKIKSYADRENVDMGTTLASALVDDAGNAFLLNVGDSRVYLKRESELIQISVDHSLVSMMLNMGLIKPEEAKNHPQSNILTRTLGIEWDVEPDAFTLSLHGGDLLLLCSDGLWGEVEDEKILEILNDFPDPREACRELVLTASYNGGRDNITVLILKHEGGKGS